MEIQVDRDALFRALQLIQNVVEPRQTLPILANVMLETFEHGLRIAATDLELGARVTVPAEVRRAGGITVPARKLVELVRELPSRPLQLSVQENSWIRLTSAPATFRLVGLPAEDYPPIESEAGDGWVEIEGQRLKGMLVRTSFAMSHDESRRFLNGVFVEVKGKELRMVATDGHRLALVRQGIEGGKEASGIVPRKAVQEMVRILGGGETVALGLRGHQFVFKMEGFLLVSKLIEGQFPNYEQVLPAAHPRRLVVDRETFVAGLRRVSVLADDRTRPVTLTLRKGEVQLASSSPDLGEAQETVPAEYTGEEFAVGFNARYLLEALGPMEGGQAVIEIKDGVSPGVLKSLGDEGYLCVIMPMRI